MRQTAGVQTAGVQTARDRIGMILTPHHQYRRLLTKGDTAAERGGEAVEAYLRAADLFPHKAEAYLKLLDYCKKRGRMEEGLRAVCARIDAGMGGIDRLSPVLFRVGELYFGEKSVKETHPVAYRKAARYFAMIDRRELPESVYYAALAEAMSRMTSKEDWEHVRHLLERFLDLNRGLGSKERKRKNEAFLHRVYEVNEAAFAKGV